MCTADTEYTLLILPRETMIARVHAHPQTKNRPGPCHQRLTRQSLTSTCFTFPCSAEPIVSPDDILRSINRRRGPGREFGIRSFPSAPMMDARLRTTPSAPWPHRTCILEPRICTSHSLNPSQFPYSFPFSARICLSRTFFRIGLRPVA